MAFGIGFQELLVILFILLLLFGGKKLPELARSLGKSIRALKEEAKDPEESKKEKKR